MIPDIDLRYPVGKFHTPEQITNSDLEGWISDIETFPARLKELTQDLKKEALGWRYRPGGWSIKQVVHHCADSHMNSQIRFKLALTEDTPTIRPYYEDRWAELPDSQADDLTSSLLILTGLHAKWGLLLRSLSTEQFERRFFHPEHQKEFTLWQATGSYAWHCRHHLAHVQQALDGKGMYNR